MQKFTPVVYFVFLPLAVNWRCHVYKSLQPDVMANCGQVHFKVFLPEKVHVVSDPHIVSFSVPEYFLLLQKQIFNKSSCF